MDVSGRTNGAYFRRNVWGWHGLADYMIDQYPALARKVTHWHSNDGDGLDEADSHELARYLRKDVEDGSAAAYVEARNDRLGRLPREVCRWCHGTGLRTDEVGLSMGLDVRRLDSEGHWVGGCNACEGTGTTEPWDRSYHLDVSDITEFAEFLESCDGFQIW